MPVSTDGVLLGSWVNLSQDGNLLDIGTGTGLLSLMCAQRYPQCSIEAIDIDPHALDAAQINFSQSAWAKRLKLHQGDVLNFPCDKLFSAIICNPPYFNNGAKAQRRKTTRVQPRDILLSLIIERYWINAGSYSPPMAVRILFCRSRKGSNLFKRH